MEVRFELPSPAANTCTIEIGDGALRGLPAALRSAAPAEHYAVITDANVAPLYGEKTCAALRSEGMRATLHVMPPGEAHKTRETWASLTDALLVAGIGRDGCVIGLGGGVVCDVAGFVAATCLRGLPIVQVPTSLLAMIDAAIGGKTAVDTPAGKNLVGAFHQPRAVVVDTATLATLPDAELRNGLAEAVKHAAIADVEYLEWLRTRPGAIRARDALTLERLVVRSVEIKTAIVSRDPLEHGERAALNFGHTIAHALERLSGYVLAHGAAVAVGMVAEAAVGEALGVTRTGTSAHIAGVLEALGLSTRAAPDSDPAALIAAARGDKKTRRTRTRYTLLAEPGSVARTDAGEWTFSPSEDCVRDVLVTLAARAARPPHEPPIHRQIDV